MNRHIPFERKWNYYSVAIPIILLVSTCIFWSAVTEIDEIVRGGGKVVPSGQTKKIQHLEGGIIGEILVEEGERINKGQSIYMLNNETFESELKQVEIQLYSFMAKEVRIQHEIDGKKSIKFPTEIAQRLPGIVDSEKNIFQVNREIYYEQISLLENSLLQEKLKLKELEETTHNLTTELRVADESLSILETLVKKGAGSRLDYLDQLKEKQKLHTRVEETNNELSITKEKINAAKKNIESFKNEHRITLLGELNTIKVEKATFIEKRKAISDREKRKLITSPVRGIVNKLYFHTIRGIIKPGDTIAEVTPIDDSLTIEAKIKAVDRAHISSGQKVSIEITAYDTARYGMLDGELFSISPDSFMDNSGNVFYMVKVKANTLNFAPDLQIMPGMMANINILTGKKTILEYIIKPLKDITRNSLREK